MWNRTGVTSLLGLKYPIIQGPFGGRYSSAKMVAAVSNLGGLGSFGLNSYAPEEILEVGKTLRERTEKPFALNLWVPLKDDPAEKYLKADFEELKKIFETYFKELGVPIPEAPDKTTLSFEDQVEAVFKVGPPVMSFIFGIPPKEVIAEAKRRSIFTIGTATSLEEALAIEEAGMDIVVASGSQAGGHRASFLKEAGNGVIDTVSLVEKVIKKIEIPVVAAGGISDGKSIAEALKLGASAVQIGTAFLATEESNASQEHKARLFSLSPTDTVLTKVYTGRLARVIANTLTRDFESRRKFNYAPYPLQSAFLSPLMSASGELNRTDYLPFYAGQPAGPLQYQISFQLFKALVAEVEKILPAL